MEAKGDQHRLKNPKTLRRVQVYAICLVLASFIWFFRSLTEDYTDTLTVPLSYAQLPEGYVMVSDPIQEIEIEIRSHGFGILADKYFSVNKPLEINVPTHNAPGKTFLEMRDLRPEIQSMIGNNGTIVGINPDTLRFSIDRLDVKEVKLIPQHNLATAPGNYIDTIYCNPSSISVTGPSSMLDTLTFLYTLPIDRTGVDHSDSVLAGVQLYTGLETNLENTKVYYSVDRMTEGSVTKTLPLIPFEDGSTLRTFPRNVTIKYVVGLNYFDKISATDFEIAIDTSAQSIQYQSKLGVSIAAAPEVVKSVTIEPQSVEFVIIASNEP